MVILDTFIFPDKWNHMLLFDIIINVGGFFSKAELDVV